MSDDRIYRATVTLEHGFEFVARFSDLPAAQAVVCDEPPPLGENHGPNAAALLGAAVANCLAASLLFCLRKSRADVANLAATVTTSVGRNADGKFRIRSIDVELAPSLAGVDSVKLSRCERLFEDFCIVTGSVRQGIPVNVTVRDRVAAASAA
jgi:organic hydroperoxide reductase OsmC/OhrA